MFYAKLNLAAAILAAVTFTGGLTGVVAWHTLAAERGERTEASPPGVGVAEPGPVSANPPPGDGRPVASKPVLQNGLRSSVAPAKAAFAAGEPVSFTVEMRNETDKDLILSRDLVFDLPDYHDNCRLEFAAAGGPQRYIPDRLSHPGPPARKNGPDTWFLVLKPAATHTFSITLSKRWGYVLRVPKGTLIPATTDGLPPGRYSMTLSLTVPELPRTSPHRQVAEELEKLPRESVWSGAITAGPVEFEIVKDAVGATGQAVPPIDLVTIRNADSGKTIKAIVGQTLEVRLRFRGWEAEPLANRVLEFLGKRLDRGLDGETSEDKPMHMAVFSYRALQAGRAELRMKYEPTGEKYGVTVEVSGPEK